MQTFTIEQTDSQCVVTWRYYRHDAAFGLFLFLAAVFYGILLNFDAAALIQIHAALIQGGFLALFALIPFLMCFALVVAIAHLLFGETQFVLDENGIESTYTLFWFDREKRIELAEISSFEKKFAGTYRMCVICQNKDVYFSPPEKEIDELCNRLNCFLETLKAEKAGEPVK